MCVRERERVKAPTPYVAPPSAPATPACCLVGCAREGEGEIETECERERDRDSV